jgi:hypothetical protein
MTMTAALETKTRVDTLALEVREFSGKGSKAAAQQYRDEADAQPSTRKTEAYTHYGNVREVRVWKTYTACAHCDRAIVEIEGTWTDPEAKGDDIMWAETCDGNDTFTAEHEPAA